MLPVTAAFAVIGAGKCWLSIWGQHHQICQPEMVEVVDNVLRIVAAVFFWRLSVRLAASGPAAAIQRLDAYTFILFCSHVLLIWLLGPVVGPLFGRFGEPGYPLFLLLQPLLALGGAVLIGTALFRSWPSAAAILSGGRQIGSAHV